jgi:hypothetical protein
MMSQQRNNVLTTRNQTVSMKPLPLATFLKLLGVVALTVALAVIITGCRKKTPAAQAPPPADTQQVQADASAGAAPQPAPAPSPNQPPLVQDNGQPDFGALNRVLLHWVASNRRLPANFNDFAATAGVTIPPPPPGKKYVIAKNMHIELANK